MCWPHAARSIQRALTRRKRNGRYRGIKITDRPSGEDNLWIFTHLPVVRMLPKPTGGELISDFNLGGVRVELPEPRQLDVFVMWISYATPGTATSSTRTPPGDVPA